MALNDLLTLGRSGLKVAPLCLGAMTFGDGEGWTCDEPTSRRMIASYLDAGGNFIDTADAYTKGQSEQIVGAALADLGKRRETVIATKFTFGGNTQDTNDRGNGRKNAIQSVEDSLRRLGTDYIDLYWLHAWDTAVPHQEVVQTFDALIRAGKIRYYGLSDVPAWFATRICDYAERTGMAAPIAMQLEYSLLERVIEREHLPMAARLGLGVTPWSPLAGGLLSGKYKRGEKPDENSRMGTLGSTQQRRLGDEELWTVLDTLQAIASKTGYTAAQIALAWAVGQYPSTSVIIGVSKEAQLAANIAALDVALDDEDWKTLDVVSRLPSVAPYNFFFPGRMKAMLGDYRTFDRYPW